MYEQHHWLYEKTHGPYGVIFIIIFMQGNEYLNWWNRFMRGDMSISLVYYGLTVFYK
jgi:predicted membrane-bound mannosyltransferase